MELKGEIVANYINNNDILSNDFLSELAYDYIKNNNIESYVQNININNNVNTCGQYNRETYSLNLNPDLNYKMSIRDYDMVDCIDYQTSIKMKKIELFNLKILHVLYHELIHAKQNYIKNEENNEISSIIKNENVLSENNINAYYDAHDRFVIEYNANFEAYLEIIKLLCTVNNEYSKQVQKLVSKYFLDNYKINNETILSPYEWMVYVFRLDYVNTDKLPVNIKILYGLPLTKQQFEFSKQKIKAA